MQLEIIVPSEVVPKSFGTWITEKIKLYLLKSINPSKLLNWNTYIEDSFSVIDSQKITAESVIKQGINNLVWYYDTTKFTIRISSSQFIKGLEDHIKLESFCKLINYGNQSIQGYPIFTDSFTYFADRINVYIDQYKEEHE